MACLRFRVSIQIVLLSLSRSQSSANSVQAPFCFVPQPLSTSPPQSLPTLSSSQSDCPSPTVTCQLISQRLYSRIVTDCLGSFAIVYLHIDASLALPSFDFFGIYAK